MDVTTFKNSLTASLVATGSSLEEWCLDSYGRKPRVFIGVDEDKPPGEKECPYVEIIIPGRHTGPSVNPRAYQFCLIATVYDRTKSFHPDVLVQEIEGVDRVERFAELVRDVFIGVLPNNASVDELIIENSSIGSYPYIQCGMTFIVHESQTIGADPY